MLYRIIEGKCCAGNDSENSAEYPSECLQMRMTALIRMHGVREFEWTQCERSNLKLLYLDM